MQSCSELVTTQRKEGKKIPRWVKKLVGLGEVGTRIVETIPKQSRFSAEKYKPLLDADFMISNKCCDVMKKRPVHRYTRENERYFMIGSLAEESFLRKNSWIRYGCNNFAADIPSSKPMSFWTEQDVLRYILDNGVKIADVYGEIICADRDGQISMDQDAKLRCSGCQRTGCVFCAYGAHHEPRFIALARTHPKQYAYCIGGGAYDPEDGYWKPTKEGLGMGHVFDEMNRLLPTKTGRPFIRYRPEGDEMERARELAEEKKNQ